MEKTDTWIEDSALKNLVHGLDWRIIRSMSSVKMRELANLIAPRETGVALIRVGKPFDGGYVLPDDFDGISACFSPGVGATANFEEDMLSRGIACFLADASVDAAPIAHERLVFDKVFLGSETDTSHISLEDWVAKYAPDDGDLVLQMDIEGAEYDILSRAPDTVLARFRIITVEFHRFHLCLRAGPYKRISAALARLFRTFVPVHLHANNARPFVRYGEYVVPRTIEMSFLRRDRVRAPLVPVGALPHPLDEANVPGHPNPPVPDWMWRLD